MLTPFHALVEEVYPKLNAEIARQLKTDLTQSEIAEFLSVSQVMVSKYLKEKKEIDDELANIATGLTNEIKAGITKQEFTKKATLAGLKLIQSGYLTEYSQQFVLDEEIIDEICHKNVKETVIKDLKAALKLIEKENPVELMPQVRMNIAVSIKKPTNKYDIAAFPGRLSVVDYKVISKEDPSFGASRHLSEILLEIKKSNTHVNSVANIKKIKLPKEVKSINYQRKKLKDIGDFIKSNDLENIDAIIAEGDFGIEPVIYVLGTSAMDVVNKIIKINRG
ncbi:thiamine-phosphate synthase family protein [Nanoarchaeota archaeon]